MRCSKTSVICAPSNHADLRGGRSVREPSSQANMKPCSKTASHKHKAQDSGHSGEATTVIFRVGTLRRHVVVLAVAKDAPQGVGRELEVYDPGPPTAGRGASIPRPLHHAAAVGLKVPSR